MKNSLLAALFFVSKRMDNAVPCIFNAWKDHAFEQRAGKLHDMLSSAHLSQGMSDLQSPAVNKEIVSIMSPGNPMQHQHN
jgi:hypothetical protein